MRRRWRAVLGALATTAVGLAALRSPSLGPSLRAGYRAFRDPSLLDPLPPPPAPLPPPIDCKSFAADTPIGDDQLARDFQRPAPEEDLDDPEGATLATLTLPDIRSPLTRRAMRYVRYFARTDAGRKTFLDRFRRAGKYRDAIEGALREAGLPEDLVWIAAVESGFDPRATSRSGAAGLFQFMPDTGQLYGLEQSPWADERRNITRSTAAAVTHLRDLYERFHRWDLALAAYNAGYDRVVSAMDRVARARGPVTLQDRPIEFNDVAAARALPEETANYVPQILAFALVAQNLGHFGLDQAEVAPSLDPGEIAVPEGTRLRTIARAAGIPTSALREYNPQLLRDRVPPTGGDYLIAVPADRVAHALATFPAYLDQEVVAQNEPEDEAADVPAVPAAEGFDPAAEDPLPRRPVALGRNRLPDFTLPGEQRVLFAQPSFADAGMLGAKLPAVLLATGIGWQKPYDGDPLGLLRGRFAAPSGAKGHDAAIDKQLGFLDELPQVAPEALQNVTLPNGISVRLRRDPGAPLTAITVRIASDPGPENERPFFAGARRAGHGQGGASEALHTLTVGPGDVDAGIELMAARVRMELGEASMIELGEIRRQAGEPRRRALESAPYGPSWLALGKALFPPGHPLAGTVIGASSDPAGARDLLVAEVMLRERGRARASITVVGDVDEGRAKKLAEAFLGPLDTPAEIPVGPHPREDRVTVEDTVPSPRALYGWVGPGEGETGDASLRVAMEILAGAKTARLRHVLVESGLGSMAEAALEVGPRASVAAIEVGPSGPHDLAEVERRLDAELASLADTGPTRVEVAVARAFVTARLKKELGTASAVVPGLVHSAPTVKLRRALGATGSDKVLAALDEVTAASVRAVVKRVLAKDHRVVVTTVPAVRASLDAEARAARP